MATLFARLTARDWLVALGLGLVAALLMFQYWGPPPVYGDPDALFYKAQALEVQGTPRAEAIDIVFSSDLADQLKDSEADLPPAERNVDNAEWVEYSSEFYRRRWAIPVAAAAVEPVLGDESLETISLVGYVFATMMLFLLLRRRFSPLVAILVTLASLLIPSMRLAAADGTTDTWGLTFAIGALLCASLALDRDDRRWIWPWAALILLLSFTRDLTLVMVLAAAAVALVQRSRTAVGLLIAAIAASLPAPLIAGTPLRESLAFAIDDFNVPADESWGYIASHYPGQIWDVIGHDLTHPLDFAFPLPMFAELAVILAGIAALALLPARGDSFIWLLRGAIVGAFLTLLVAALYSSWKIELAMLPAIAVGVALLTERAIAWLPRSLGGDALRGLEAPPGPKTSPS